MSVLRHAEAAWHRTHCPLVGRAISRRGTPCQHKRKRPSQSCARYRVQCSSTSDSVVAQPGSNPVREKAQQGKRKQVLILGGTGRVGGSTACALLEAGINADLTLGSREEGSYHAAKQKRPALGSCRFMSVDRDSPASLRAALQGYDLVVHTAGPFQRKEDCHVLEAAIETGTPYVDVCDDSDYAARAKGLHGKAKAAGVPAITSAGIYPGVSNVMAAHMVSIARREYDKDWNFVGRDEGHHQETAVEPKAVRFSYYTAGTGGVGPTIMETSFLLAGTPVISFLDGKRVVGKPISSPRIVDFGPGLGRKSVWLYHLPELHGILQAGNRGQVESIFTNLKVPTVSARFGTDPNFWNWGMILMARLAPKSLLEDRDKIKAFSKATNGLITSIDPIVGEKVGMRVDVELDDGSMACGVYIHRKLSDSAGVCTAAFAQSMLTGGCQPGCWFPEEPEAVKDRRSLLAESAIGCMRFELNQAPWRIESDVKQLGMGLYW